MDYYNSSGKKHRRMRAVSLLLALCLALSLIPILPGAVSAAPGDSSSPGQSLDDSSSSPAADGSSDDDVQSSLDKLVSWGVMRGDSDGGLYPERSLTRAEFTALVNRAYGYDQMGKTPFKDVDEKAWYADDIAIAYNTGYFNGSSDTTASPERTLTREEALVLLARSLRLQEIPGQVVELADGNDVSNWARGYVRAAVQAGLISDEGGKGFRPTDIMTRGEMAELLVRSVGSLVTAGDHTLGNVFGNVTVNQTGTTIRDTVIAGDLYITGGVGLGGITLENTTVLGKIVVAGGGESEKGEDSVVLRNVEAEELIVDSIRNQYNSLRSEGDTSIQNATLRTSAFVQDRSDDGFGFLNVSLDGRLEEMSFTVSGNMKKVINKTAGSTLTMSDGAVQELTVDEKAVDSLLNIERGGVVHKLNLDTAVDVTGKGDIQSLQVSAAGSSVEMLPDQIAIRPGIIANIFGQDMDNQQAHESSNSPRLLAGYPKVLDVASTSATAVFATNKPGTVYWAISAQNDGSISEEDLLRPGSYNNKAILQGNVKVTEANDEFEAAIKSLSADGSYYLSAILVDGRGNRSPLKVVSFGTPDDSVPAFTQGYPKITRIGTGSGPDSTQAAAMTTKSCVLYYALFPAGSKAPTPNDFRSGALSGNLGSGSRTVVRNTEVQLVNVNREQLQEQTTYDLYFWLKDIDGAKSSAVIKLTFTTLDATPPKFVTDLAPTKIQATSVSTSGSIDEAGTIFWAAVKKGTKYPKAPSGTTTDIYEDENAFAEFLRSDYAKIQIENGGGSPVKNGRVNAQENKDFTLTVSGLLAETAYDIYYVAKDKAGNYSDTVKILTVNTEDNVPPTVTQRFSKYANNNVNDPFANTDVDIVFSETVRVNNVADANGELLALYEKVTSASSDAERWKAKAELAAALSQSIKLYSKTVSNLPTEVTPRTHALDGTVTSPSDDEWGIDYYNAQVLMDDTDPAQRRMIVRFLNKNNAADSALKLKSGSEYYFEVSGITDTSTAQNILGTTQLPKFTTVPAQVILEDLNLTKITKVFDSSGNAVDLAEPVSVDGAYSMFPQSTSSVEDNLDWDMIIWSDTPVTFYLYYKLPGEAAWHKSPLGNNNVTSDLTSQGISVQRGMLKQDYNDRLNTLDDGQDYQYAIVLNSVDGSTDRDTWSGKVTMRIQAITGNSAALRNQSIDLTNYMLNTTKVQPINSPEIFEVEVAMGDTKPPEFVTEYPIIDAQDTVGTLKVNLTRPGTVYYVMAPATETSTAIQTIDTEGHRVTAATQGIPYMENGILHETKKFLLSDPTVGNITQPRYDITGDIIVGTPKNVGTGVVDIPLVGLKANTTYFIYFVLKGNGNESLSPNVMLYKFTTKEIIRPVIELSNLRNPEVDVTSDIASNVDYLLTVYTVNDLPKYLTQDFKNVCLADADVPTEYQAYWKNNKKDLTATGFSVLEALNEDVRSSGASGESLGSVFDLFAKQSIKDQVAKYIRSQSTAGGSKTGGNMTLTAGQTKTVDCSKLNMSPDVPYVFLAVGRSVGNTATGGNSGDAFRAIYTIELEDKTPPMIEEILISMEADEATGSYLTGTLTLNFSEPLYRYLEKGSNQQAVMQPISLTTEDDTLVPGTNIKFYPVSLAVQNLPLHASIVGVDPGIPGEAIRSLTFQFENSKIPGIGSLNLQFAIQISDDSTNVNSTLSVQITVAKDKDGKPTGIDVRIPRSWDATPGQSYSKK